MARQESDREDLIREAAALSPRIEWGIVGEPGVVFAGLKRNGALSLYFDQDPVYQFDVEGRLRRAYVDGFLYRSDGDRLAELHRERSETETVLVRQDIVGRELDAFLSTMQDRLRSLIQKLQGGQATVLRSVCDHDLPNFEPLIANAVEHAHELAPAIAPARSRR